MVCVIHGGWLGVGVYSTYARTNSSDSTMALDEMTRRNLANSGQSGANSSDSERTGLTICDGSIGPQYVYTALSGPERRRVLKPP